jgi:hypothetical protein
MVRGRCEGSQVTHCSLHTEESKNLPTFGNNNLLCWGNESNNLLAADDGDNGGALPLLPLRIPSLPLLPPTTNAGDAINRGAGGPRFDDDKASLRDDDDDDDEDTTDDDDDGVTRGGVAGMDPVAAASVDNTDAPIAEFVGDCGNGVPNVRLTLPPLLSLVDGDDDRNDEDCDGDDDDDARAVPPSCN